MASGTGELNASAVGPRFDLSAFAAVGAGAIAIVYPVYLVLMFQTGNWILGTDGRPGVSDFLVFYLAGQLALKGAAASAYVPQLLHAAEAAVVGHGFSSQLPWRYAPLFLFVTAPLALLPYVSAFLLWIAGTLALFAGVVSRIARSPVGLILQASGQDAIEAAALGFNVAKHKLAAFCISAFFSGLAGAMLIFYLGTASVGTVVDIAVGVNVIIAAVLGGRRTIIGAAVGAIFLIGAGEILRPLGQLSTFVVSAVALVVILFFPGGFMGRLLQAGGRE